jgi:type II secretory pathway component GspD/PulD (secretin)
MKVIIKSICAVFILIVLSVLSYSQQPGSSIPGGPPGIEPIDSSGGGAGTSIIQIKGKLIEQLKGEFSGTFQGMPLKDVVANFSMQSGLNFIVSPNVNAQVTASFKNASLKDAFLSVLSTHGIYYLEQGNIVKILSLAEYKSELQKSFLITKTYDASIIDLKNFVSVIKPLLTPGVGSVTIDAQSSKIIIVDVPDNFGRIDQLFTVVSSLPKMVIIETKMVQVDLEDKDEVGIRWEALNLGDAVNLSFLFAPQTGVGQSGEKFNASASKTFSDSHIGVDALISALAHNYHLKLISQPQVLAINRGSAMIHIGSKVPYIKSIVKNQTSLDLTSQVEFLDVGIMLKVEPTITPAGEVKLTLVGEMSSYQTIAITATENAPKKITTEFSCDAIAKDGQTIIIGGLIRTEVTSDVNAVPILGEIPILRYLFSHSVETVTRSELVIFLTPHIVDINMNKTGLNKVSPDVLKEAGLTNITEMK